MTIRVTEAQLRDIQWTHHRSELVHATVRPAKYDHDEERGETLEESPVSEAFGYSVLRGDLAGVIELTLLIDWASSGDTRGSFNDLYDWAAPMLNVHGPDNPAALEHDVVLLDDEGDPCEDFVLQALLEELARDIEDVWQHHAAAQLPEAPEPYTPEPTDPPYTVLALVPGTNEPRREIAARGWESALGYAQHLATLYGSGEPVWCGAEAWHEHPSAPGMRPVGGYDARSDQDHGIAAMLLPLDARADQDHGVSAVIYTDIDENEDTDMQDYTVLRDNAPDIRFTGEEIANASSRMTRGPSEHRWAELRLYKTRSGRYICSQIGFSNWEGERNRYSGTVCDTTEEIVAYFGQGWLAKELYEESGIDAAEHID